MKDKKRERFLYNLNFLFFQSLDGMNLEDIIVCPRVVDKQHIRSFTVLEFRYIVL